MIEWRKKNPKKKRAVSQSNLEYFDVTGAEYEPKFEADQLLDSCSGGPGSAEKVKVMADRYASGQPLWHPGDEERVDPLTRSERGERAYKRSSVG